MGKIIMILTNRFDPDVRVYKEAKYLISKGENVEILCWDRENEYRHREIENVEGIRVKRFFPEAKYGTGFKQIISYVRFIWECKKYLKGRKYRVLHCHDLDGIIAGYFSKSKTSKLVFDMHEIYEVQGAKQKIRYLIRFIVGFFQNKSDDIIYVNEVQKSFMNEKNKSKLIYLPNYPEIRSYLEVRKVKSDKLRISYIGVVRQFGELKNLMEACKNISNVEVSIHGAGTAYRRLNEIKDNYRNVCVTGVYHFSESTRLYSQTDVLYALYPMNSIQNRNAYPVKFFEAIITKTPIIVSKGSILEEFLKENDIGFVVDGNDVEKIKELISYINKNRSILEKKVKNLERIQYDYSWEKVVGNLDVLLS